jgi:Flp pilus assembly protein TadG
MFGWTLIRAARKGLGEDCRGVAATEFAFIAGFLCLGIVNVSDIGIYIYKRMEVENAAQMGTMMALSTCDPDHLPATVNCPGLSAAVATAIQSTSLGGLVSLGAGGISEGYYCVNSSNALQLVGSLSSKPANCTAAGMPALLPGDYVKVSVTFAYTPLFSGISVAGTFTTPITKTAWVRMI